MFSVCFSDEKQRICFRIGSVAATSGRSGFEGPNSGCGGRGSRGSHGYGGQVDGSVSGCGGSRLGRQTHAGTAPLFESPSRGAGENLAVPKAYGARFSHRPLECPPDRRISPPKVRCCIPSGLHAALAHRTRLLAPTTRPQRRCHRSLGGERLAADSKKASETSAHIVLINESGLFLNPLVRRTWAPKGQTPVLEADGGHRKKVSVIGGISV